MLAVIAWECECGCKVKAMYDTNGAVRVQCPLPPCKKTHIVAGKIMNMWFKDGDDRWRDVDLAKFIVS